MRTTSSTAGMVLTALDLLRREPAPTREQARQELSGNICRWTGYKGIVNAVEAAAAALAKTSQPRP